MSHQQSITASSLIEDAREIIEGICQYQLSFDQEEYDALALISRFIAPYATQEDWQKYWLLFQIARMNTIDGTENHNHFVNLQVHFEQCCIYAKKTRQAQSEPAKLHTSSSCAGLS